MNNTPARATSPRLRSDQAFSRVLMAVCMAGLTAVLLGVVWFRQTRSTSAVSSESPVTENATPGLSEATLAVIQRLTVPVEIRFYSVLNESEAAAPRRAYAGRIAGLLAEYERAGGGKVIVKHLDSMAQANAAAAEGLEPLRTGRDLNYFGISVVCEKQRAVMSNLSPDWEAALEFDLSRAIARVSGGAPVTGEAVVNPAPVNPVSTEELLAVVPEVEKLSLAEATQKVKSVGMEEFKTAAAEIQKQLATAHQRLADAQKESPEAERSARAELHKLQSEQNEKLAEIAHRMQGRLTALQQLKRSSP